jgi:hypothetical protein
VGGEVLVKNRKVIGSAQLRRGNALLQHGSILLHDDQHSIIDLMRGGWEPGPSPADERGPPLQVGDLADAIGKSVRLRWPGTWVVEADAAQVMAGASRYHQWFQSFAWTWAR